MESLRIQFQKDGYVVINDLLSEKEALSYAQSLEKMSNIPLHDLEKRSFRWNLKNGISVTPTFWSLIFNKDLHDIIRKILDSSTICYTEQSELKVWAHQPASGWHRDNVSKHYGTGPEWNGTANQYKVVRVAFYFQSSENQFQWGALPGSHRYEQPLSNWEKRLWQMISPRPQPQISSRLPYLDGTDGRLWIHTTPSRFGLRPPTEPHWLQTKPVNCVIFDPRLIHVGGDVSNRKYAALFSFGADNEFSRNHLHYYNPAKYIGYDATLRKSFEAELAKANLKLN